MSLDLVRNLGFLLGFGQVPGQRPWLLGRVGAVASLVRRYLEFTLSDVVGLLQLELTCALDLNRDGHITSELYALSVFNINMRVLLVVEFDFGELMVDIGSPVGALAVVGIYIFLNVSAEEVATPVISIEV